jgi:nucleoside 2-deoxyribosyltransferase
MSKTVYLAGPITGLDYKGCTDWRQSAKAELAAVGIEAFSPMRCKEYLDGLPTISGHGREYHNMGPLSTPKGVVTRDHYDVHRCDMLLVNLLGAKQVSIGTMFEMAWAFQKKTPIVLAMDETGGLHDHMFVHQTCGYRLGTLDEALRIVRAILL